jgi:predicted ribosomally synthesized peptide with SipW-like signal peptide
MTDDDPAAFELSRRKTLAALGTIGVASAGAGLGTSAYFSDTETFENNRLTAGTLDMVVDWEEHYSDWKGEETEYAEMPGPNDDPDYVLPAPADNPNAEDIELVFTETQQDFWDATAIEAYPDENNDALREAAEVPCDDLGSLNDVLSSDLRTNNEYTSPDDPLISLQDVKPGDFGEVTLSFHLCDNPGYVWFGGDLIRHVDGENTEPEIDDPDEQQSAGEIGPETEGELAGQIQVRAWYDDCDNIYEPEEAASCVYHLVDNSGTMEQNLNLAGDPPRDKANVATDIGRNLTNYLDTIDDGGGDGTLADAPSSVSYIQDGTFNKEISNSTNEETNGGPGIIEAFNDVPDNSSGGITADNIIDGLNDAGTELVENCDNENKVLIFYTNGDSRPGNDTDRQAVYDAAADLRDDGVLIKVVAFDVDEDSLAEDFLQTVGDEYYTIQPANSASDVDDQAAAVEADLEDNFAPAQTGEELFYRGTLADFLAGTGNQAGDDGEPFDPDNNQLGFELSGDLPAEEGGGMSQRNCFSAVDTHCIGFEWWLPIDHGNEVQGDIVEFDLGFYTEQCRHNDGSGMNAETVNDNNA